MVYLIWLECDDIDSMLVGVATDENKAKEMRDKLVSTDGFECCEYNIVPMKLNTVTINDVDYNF